MNGLRYEFDARRGTDAVDGIEARLRVGTQGRVQRLAGYAGRLGNIAHPACPGDIPERRNEIWLTPK